MKITSGPTLKLNLLYVSLFIDFLVHLYQIIDYLEAYPIKQFITLEMEHYRENEFSTWKINVTLVIL